MLKYELILENDSGTRIKCSYLYGMMHGKYITNTIHLSYIHTYQYDKLIRICPL